MEDKTVNPQDLDYYTDLPVGEIIKRARIYYNQSIEDVSKALKIRAEMLDAIENGDIDKLPVRVYAIGFVRSYSEYLKLDSERIIHLFKMQLVGGRSKPEITPQAPVGYSKTPSITTIIASILTAIAILIFWVGTNKPETVSKINIPEISEHYVATSDISQMMGKSPEEIIETSPKITIEENNIDTVKESKIAISIVNRSWVQVKNADGKRIISKMLKTGHYYEVPEGQELFLTTGNAAGVILIVNGQKMPALGSDAELVRNLPLTIEAIENKFKKD